MCLFVWDARGWEASHKDKIYKIENLHIFPFEDFDPPIYFIVSRSAVDCSAIQLYLVHCKTFVVLQTKNSSNVGNE